MLSVIIQLGSSGEFDTSTISIYINQRIHNAAWKNNPWWLDAINKKTWDKAYNLTLYNQAFPDTGK